MKQRGSSSRFATGAVFVALAVLLGDSAAAQVVGPAEDPEWADGAQIRLGWAFGDPMDPGASAPLDAWDVFEGQLPVWDYDADRIEYDNPAQWHVQLSNVEDPGEAMLFRIAWVYSYTGSSGVFTSLSWDPFDSYEDFQTHSEFFAADGEPAEQAGAAFGRFTQSVTMFPDPDTIDIHLGVDLEAAGMEVTEVYVLGATAADADADGDADGDSDADSDVDSDTDTDGDADGGADAGTDEEGGCDCRAAGRAVPLGLVPALGLLFR
jgi:hypothetical protein